MKQQPTILHVDDDKCMLRFVKKLLSGFDYDVVSVQDSSQALDALAASNARLVILDIDMPEIDGLTLLEHIKTYDGGVLVIMLSGVVTMMTALEAMRMGAEACVFKPINDLQPLQSAIEAAFLKIESWENAIRELEQRRSAELTPA